MYKPPLVDMENSKEKKEATEVVEPAEYEGPRYPWGLCLSLRQEELDKLGLSFDSLKVGGILSLSAIAKITAKSANESESGEMRNCIELQITHLGADDGARNENDNRAEGRYKESLK